MQPKSLALIPVADVGNSKRVFAVLDWDNDEVGIERRMFNIDTFADLKRSPDTWDRLAPVNQFLATLDRDESFYLLKLFMKARRELINLTDKQSVINAVINIDQLVAATFLRLNLSERLFDFTVADPNIVVYDSKDSGQRLQDTPEMTFLRPDYDLTNTILVLTKLLFPIYGEIISRIKSIPGIDNDSKELLAFGVMNTVLARDFGAITIKINNYIARIIRSTMQTDSMAAFRGITETSAVCDRLAKTLVKSGVNFNLYRESGNFIRYLAVTIRRSLKNDSGNTKSIFFPRLAIDSIPSDDGRNISMQENEAHTVHEAIEVPIIVDAAVEYFISSYIEQNNIPVEIFDRIVNYYKMTTVPITQMNELLAAVFISEPIGSAYCMRYLNMDSMIRILTLMQFYAVKMGFGEMVPFLTMNTTSIKKVKADPVDNHLLISDGRGTGSVNYMLYIKEETAHLADFSQLNIDEYLIGDSKRRTSGILQFIVSSVHNYNVAPDIEALGSFGESHNSSGVLKYGKNIANETFRFIYQMLVGDSSRKIT